MPLENENDPDSITQNLETDNIPVSRKGGRPKGAKNKIKKTRGEGLVIREQRRYEVSLNECIRKGMHPELILEYYKIILRGQTPVLEYKDGLESFIPDPNPLTPTPTLEQRNAAMRALADRGYGLPAQSVTIDAEFKNKVELQLTGITTEQFGAIAAQNLYKLREMFSLPEPKEDNSDALDAEFTEINDNNPSTDKP